MRLHSRPTARGWTGIILGALLVTNGVIVAGQALSTWRTAAAAEEVIVSARGTSRLPDAGFGGSGWGLLSACGVLMAGVTMTAMYGARTCTARLFALRSVSSAP